MAATDYRQYGNLITAAEVVDIAMTNANMDTSIIDDNIILIAEITHLKQYLGDYFWGELRKRKQNDALGSTEETLLGNYIKPCLALYVKYEVLNDMQYNTSSSGITINTDEWSEVADNSEIGRLREDTFRKAEILKNDMMDWLDDSNNAGIFVNYEHSENNRHSNGDNVTRIGGILAYGNNLNHITSYKRNED
jgi:hypothetical protein